MIRSLFVSCVWAIWLICAGQALAAGDATAEFTETCLSIDPAEGRVVCADVAALDQTLVYNRFGSFNPFGMIFALNRDVVPIMPVATTGDRADLRATAGYDDCDLQLGTETRPEGQHPSAGAARLRDCKRPRPVVLRVNVGDQLLVHVTNLLAPGPAPDLSDDFCGSDSDDPLFRAVRPEVEGPDSALSPEAQALQTQHHEVDCAPKPGNEAQEAGSDWPNTRHVNFVVQGLAPIALPGEDAAQDACFGTGAVDPDADFYCLYKVQQEGTYFFASLAAPAGGEGNGGSLVHGLFGAVVAERPGARWYRSQVTQAALDAAWPAAGEIPNRTRAGSPDYEAADGAGVPILNMARVLPDDGPAAGVLGADHVELVHSDLNAIIYCDMNAQGPDCAPELSRQGGHGKTVEPAYRAFREFSVFFHDELKTFYTRNFRELGQLGQLAGVKDGFAINYGASGMGSLLLANRKGIGPADDCMECLYEEFFLTSWANGDPALLEGYPDDPSNVHHSYLNDPVVFRNFHAGPKETHVFHLHAHQWFAGNDPSRGAYLDSQTVAPQQGFTYNIYHGGLRGPDGTGAEGWWDSQGSGNRNRTVGDSIFHCHLYPHFAQGMWALWRVHDVLEDGTRLLPDGQPDAGLSVDFTPAAARGEARRGSIDRKTGLWLTEQEGTPVPALVPLPGEAIPLAPSYATEADLDSEGALSADAATPMPGYPFYIAGQPGHRPPQAPLDIARNLGAPPDHDTVEDGRDPTAPAGAFAGIGDWLDGGLGRHVVGGGSEREFGITLPPAITDPAAFAALDEPVKVNAMRQVIAKAFALGDLSGHLTRAGIEPLDPYGERLERAAMGFHYDGRLYAEGDDAPAPDAPLKLRAIASADPVAFDARGGYPTTEAALPPVTPATSGDEGEDPAPVARIFAVNGAAPRPGAPFADPCGVRNGPPEAGVTIPLDPLTGSWLPQPMTRDRQLAGFRRYEASAVQLDMVVNRAGWHDPQARINVLTRESDDYKHGSRRAQAPFDAISPVVSDSEEPFFFRALSGECIEFRHTNELPKELELDDFQVKTPTDTIGQHIHLVKFDVTSSDGSGNGWNYEDGTLAPDEIAGRLCAWAETVADAADAGHPARQAVERLGLLAHEAAAASDDPVIRAAFATPDFCASAAVRDHDVWRLPRGQFPFLFQTTTQRWFADPILSKDEDGEAVDRTMRTVFTHDHFGPSSIQQHGFYAALLIEPPAGTGGNPAAPQICDAMAGGDCVQPLPGGTGDKVAWGSDLWEGARKLVKTAANDPEHPSFREFALSIADFALLYDPRDRQDPEALRRAMRDPTGRLAGELGSLQGMAKIYCEARYRRSPFNLRDVCGTAPQRDGSYGSFWFPDMPPAWLAGGVYRDDVHKNRYLRDLLIDVSGAQPELGRLWTHLVDYRRKAAAPGRAGEAGVMMASPIAAPERPESISVDHHDPYLVNYRGAPVPLRIADKTASAQQSGDCAPKAMRRPADHGSGAGDDSEVVAALVGGSFGQCSYSHQMTGDRGDLASALHSGVHAGPEDARSGDPETPVLEAYANERLVFRMIQGAQEVQHSFNLMGQALKRNIDQAFGQAARPLANVGAKSLQDLCHERADIVAGRPGKYREWFETAPSRRAEKGWSDDPADDEDDISYWTRYEAALAECDNPEGFTTAQEIGISEHFEMQGSLRSDVASPAEFGAAAASASADLPASPPEDDPTVPTHSSDYLWHFGTVDALWNGAWGLLRIFEGPDAPDPATVPAFNGGTGATGTAIGQRLGAPIEGPETAGASDQLVLPGGTGLSCPMPIEGRKTRLVDAAIVAFETREVFDPKGTAYGEGVHDPDGLMLALLSPEQIGAPDITDNGAWAGLDKAAVIAALQAAYPDQPEPFLLRVHAGDCLRLRIVNLLGQAGGTMRDLPGDAILPRIVPLNADPIPQNVETTETGRKLLALAPLPDASAPNGLRASAGLALSLGLPGLDLIRDVPSGFGYNRKVLPGGFGGVSVSPLVAAYAGRYRLDLPEETGSQSGDIADAATDHVSTLAGADPARYFGRFTRPDGATWQVRLDVLPSLDDSRNSGIARILGDEYLLRVRPEGSATDVALTADPASLAPALQEMCGSPDCPEGAGLHAELTALTQTALATAVDGYTHWIPYAFGALPVKPSGDVISQATHGLFGAIDVVPTTWQPVGSDGLDCDADPVAGYERCSAAHVPGLGHGQPARYLARATPDAAETVPIREFVLFYQDGLNHWDEASSLRVVSAETGAAWPATEAGPARLVPDCPICDDSYDRGERAVSQHSPALSRALRTLTGVAGIEESDDLNTHIFPRDYTTGDVGQPRLQACEGEQIVIRVLHPGGRARQHAFAMNGYSYDELFPGFGFPRSALLAPGKAVTAWLHPRAYPGKTVWHDGPTHLRAGGIWGLIETAGREADQCAPAASY